MRRTLWYILVAATTVVIVILLWQFSLAIVLFLLSLALAAALRSLINNLIEKKFSRWGALAVVYLSLIASLIISLLWLSQPIFQDMQKAVNDFVAGYERIIAEWPQKGTLFSANAGKTTPTFRGSI